MPKLSEAKAFVDYRVTRVENVAQIIRYGQTEYNTKCSDEHKRYNETSNETS